MITRSIDRVAIHTTPWVTDHLNEKMRERVAYYATHPEEISDRLRELDEEWDIERVLETNSSALSLIGLTLGILGRRRWLLLPLVVQGFFLQHSIQGWCPPLPFLRRRGFRTQQEIEQERYALKALRGDFEAQKRTEPDDPDARARFALRAAYAGQETAKETPS